MKLKSKCSLCDSDLDKDMCGINKKTRGMLVKNFYCIECLANYLDVTVDELLEQIAEYKEDGCSAFR